MTRKRTPQEHLDVVRSRYADIAKRKQPSAKRTQSSCCGDAGQAEDTSCCGEPSSLAFDLREAARTLGYTEAQLAALPEGESLSLGCGNPLAAALLEQGMTVLDLGSGAGFDCFIAADQVGARGHVIGVDMTPEMIGRARTAGADRPNVEFRLGELEHLPVADGTVVATLTQ